MLLLLVTKCNENHIFSCTSCIFNASLISTDTGYSEWTPWSACSRSCGIHAIKTRTRTCQTGFPGRGNCEGSIDERIPCHLHFPCPKGE